MKPEELERVTTGMIAIMEMVGIPIDSKTRMRTYIYHAFNDDRIKFIDQEGQPAGFMIWELHDKDGDRHVYVSQLVIMDNFRGFNLRRMVTFLKTKYEVKNSNIHWHNHKRNKQVDFNKKELNHG